MKLNLGCGDDIRSHDFLNIDIVPKNLAPEVFKQGDVVNLDGVCLDGTVEEILALNVLPYIKLADMDRALSCWIRKLKKGGVLRLSSPDLWSICRDFFNDRADLTNTLNAIYGTQDGEHDSIKSAVDTRSLVERLTGEGMRITVKRIEGFMTYVEAVKL